MNEAPLNEAPGSRVGNLGWIGAALAIAAGAALLLAWPADIEYKGDEQWIFAHATALAGGAAWPSVGMTSSVGSNNTGMSLWVFGVLAYLSNATTPPDLARAVQMSNIAALLALAVFVRYAVARRDREFWLWGLALWAVNPIAVILERKIWLPSVLPLPCVLFIAAWWYRRRPAGAALWGLIGAMMGQIQLTAPFFVAAVAGWTFLCDRKSVAWRWWIAGGLIGSLPAVPWLLQILGGAGSGPVFRPYLRVPNPTFYLRWATQPFGFGIEYSLGHPGMVKFLTSPWVAGQPTYLMGLTQIVLICLLAVIYIRAVRGAVRSPLPSVRGAFLGDEPATLLTNAALWGYGLILTLITIGRADSHRHYLIVVLPLMALWAVRLVYHGDQTPERRTARGILLALCIAEATASLGFLAYVHQTQNICDEYGQTWALQQSGAPGCQ